MTGAQWPTEGPNKDQVKEMYMSLKTTLLATAIALAATAQAARAEDSFKIGSALGLTGYAATGDRNWRDGLQLAADALNAKGGILGRKVEIIVEDNRSQPQDAVVAYRKMLSSDQVNAFDSGCVSAGNMAAASFVARAQVPMLLCSILPQKPEEQAWAFSFLPPPTFEIDARYGYLRDRTQIRKVGLLIDPTPYSQLMKGFATRLAPQYGLEIVAEETYKPDDSDVNVQLGRMNAAGAGAVVKLGQGGSTVTVAKNIRQLGLDKMVLMASTDDGGIFKSASEVLGDRFYFIGSAVQFGDAGPSEKAANADKSNGAAKAAIDAFLTPWVAKYGDRDTGQASRAYDSVMLLAKAATAANSVAGPAIKDAIERVGAYNGAGAVYDFSDKQHVGITKNPYFVGQFVNGRPTVSK